MRVESLEGGWLLADVNKLWANPKGTRSMNQAEPTKTEAPASVFGRSSVPKTSGRELAVA
jgi:hypothetical protein